MLLLVVQAELDHLRQARDLLRNQNRSVRRALYDEKKLEEAADQAVKALLQKGRVEI